MSCSETEKSWSSRVTLLRVRVPVQGSSDLTGYLKQGAGNSVAIWELGQRWGPTGWPCINRVRTDRGPNHTALCGDKPGSGREGHEGMGGPLGNVLWQEAQGIEDLREESTKYTQVITYRSIHTDQYIPINSYGWMLDKLHKKHSCETGAIF